MLLDPRPHWVPLCRILELEELIDDPGFATDDARIANSDDLIPFIQDRIGARDFAYWKGKLDSSFDGPWERIQTIEDRPAPLLGEHSAELLREVGYSANAIADLRTPGIAR
jgi:crotonobetainyl-CoA:carnitine CoA-transferase CaiB-like acyl-CoA transferase